MQEKTRKVWIVVDLKENILQDPPYFCAYPIKELAERSLEKDERIRRATLTWMGRSE
jgi:hypothetical protein